MILNSDGKRFLESKLLGIWLSYYRQFTSLGLWASERERKNVTAIVGRPCHPCTLRLTPATHTRTSYTSGVTPLALFRQDRIFNVRLAGLNSQVRSTSKRAHTHNHLIFNSCLAILESIPLELRFQNNTNLVIESIFLLRVFLWRLHRNVIDIDDDDDFDDKRWQSLRINLNNRVLWDMKVGWAARIFSIHRFPFECMTFDGKKGSSIQLLTFISQIYINPFELFRNINWWIWQNCVMRFRLFWDLPICMCIYIWWNWIDVLMCRICVVYIILP